MHTDAVDKCMLQVIGCLFFLWFSLPIPWHDEVLIFQAAAHGETHPYQIEEGRLYNPTWTSFPCRFLWDLGIGSIYSLEVAAHIFGSSTICSRFIPHTFWFTNVFITKLQLFCQANWQEERLGIPDKGTSTCCTINQLPEPLRCSASSFSEFSLFPGLQWQRHRQRKMERPGMC